MHNLYTILPELLPQLFIPSARTQPKLVFMANTPDPITQHRSRTTLSGHRTMTRHWTIGLALPGILALAWEPARWLVQTWRAPAYGSDGAWIALVVAGLLLASCRSGPAAMKSSTRRIAWALLALTAALRLVGRLLAIDTVGALALVVDVGAVAMLLGVSRRPLALHPWVLAGFFALSLPLEHIAQRIMGHPLQLVAAMTSETLLSPFYPGLAREGVLLLHPALELAVDLPCSGARGLVVFASIALGLWTCHRLDLRGVIGLLIAVPSGALLANAARIVALFVSGVHGIPLIEEPWHSALGTGVLALGAIPMLGVFRKAQRRRPRAARLFFEHFEVGQPIVTTTFHTSRVPWPAALAVSVLGLAVAATPQRPLDVAPADRDIRLPTTLGHFRGSEIPLAPDEARFFAQWGGRADKRHYDDGNGNSHTALLIRTRSPLRHLHGPDLCLIGSGHKVTRIGVVPGAVPSVLYKSVAPDGSIWRVEASFASDAGETASSVSEVVWRWLAQPETSWNLIERISPWEACERVPRRCTEFDRALFTSLDLPVSN